MLGRYGRSRLLLGVLLVVLGGVTALSTWVAVEARSDVDALRSEVERVATSLQRANASLTEIQDSDRTQEEETVRVRAFLDGLPGGGDDPEYFFTTVGNLWATVNGICDLSASGYGIREVTSEDVDLLLDFIKIPCRRMGTP